MKPDEIISFKDSQLILLDQRLLPNKVEYLNNNDYKTVSDSIRDMVVRGAPAIGVAAAYGYLMGVSEALKLDVNDREAFISEMKNHLLMARPTAVNLAWAIKRMHQKYLQNINDEDINIILLAEAESIHLEQIESDKIMGRFGSELLSKIGKSLRVLTHCNAGALATGGIGTALGVIKTAYSDGILQLAYSAETRPRQQGARLTCFEFKRDNIPYKLISDTMPGYMMSQNMIDAVVVGADRIARNGDTANKIGTYQIAALAKRHSVPFYISAPVSTFDFSTPDGSGIPVEERSSDEITLIGSERIAPENTEVYNPSFDITPAELIGAFITEKGIVRKPDELQ